LIRKEVFKLTKNPLVQVSAIDQYEKANKSTSKDYPSLELVRLEKLFFKGKKGKVLEYAFGSGCNTKHLLKKNYTVFGIDVSKNAVINLKKKLKKKRIKKKLKLFLLNRNTKKIPFKSKTFDYVVAMSILSLLGSKQKITYLLKELNRVLKKDGKIILDINDQNSEFSKNNLTKKKNLFLSKIMDKKIYTYCLNSSTDFKKLVNPYFKIIDVGFSAHKVFGRRIKEFIICGIKK
jgi:ubiquinone/menaquinone biosynthesis C-methylase UbiE